jgi:uracil-DNA glycosylase
MYKYLPHLAIDWLKLIQPRLSNDFFLKMDQALTCCEKIIYPSSEDVFRAFSITRVEEVKVVLLGQDPYHGPGEACGLAFGVKDSIKWPPSLKNLAKELESDLGEFLDSSQLVSWAKQGVLLLNRTLTVFKDEPLSHKDMGWDAFLEAVLKSLIDLQKPLIFISLGKESEKLFNVYKDLAHHKIKFLHYIHPSPLSAHRGFFGSKMYSNINQALIELGLKPIKFGSNAQMCFSISETTSCDEGK